MYIILNNTNCARGCSVAIDGKLKTFTFYFGYNQVSDSEMKAIETNNLFVEHHLSQLEVVKVKGDRLDISQIDDVLAIKVANNLTDINVLDEQLKIEQRSRVRIALEERRELLVKCGAENGSHPAEIASFLAQKATPSLNLFAV